MKKKDLNDDDVFKLIELSVDEFLNPAFKERTNFFGKMYSRLVRKMYDKEDISSVKNFAKNHMTACRRAGNIGRVIRNSQRFAKSIMVDEIDC